MILNTNVRLDVAKIIIAQNKNSVIKIVKVIMTACTPLAVVMVTARKTLSAKVIKELVIHVIPIRSV